VPARSTNRRLTVAALLASIAMSALEATVVGTAMPTVIADLGGIDRYGWVGAAYLLASTVTMPLYGKLADLYGRRPTLVFGIVMFTIGSALSGAAPSMDFLIAARALQGLGAGAMQPVSMTIIGDLFKLEERGRVQGLFGTVWGVSGMAGPILGGYIVQTIGWQWVFWINLPFGLIAIPLLFFAYHEERRERPRVSVDWAGGAALTLASIALLLGAQREWPWLTFPLGVALAVLFVGIERRAASPVLPLGLVTERRIAVTSFASFFLGAAMMGAVMFLPLFAQGVLGATAPEAGSTIAAMLIGWPIAAAFTTRMVTRIGFRLPMIFGTLLVLAGLGTLAWLARPGVSLWALRGSMLVYGLGMGLSLTAQLLAVQSGVTAKDRGVATSTNLFARSMGGALGAGALGAVFAAALGASLPAETVSALLDASHRSSVATPEIHDALAQGLAPIFQSAAALAALAMIASLLYPPDAARPASPPSPSEPALAH
jgi:EmrB/QacA subfamily drug resistance transporter